MRADEVFTLGMPLALGVHYVGNAPECTPESGDRVFIQSVIKGMPR